MIVTLCLLSELPKACLTTSEIGSGCGNRLDTATQSMSGKRSASLTTGRVGSGSMN